MFNPLRGLLTRPSPVSDITIIYYSTCHMFAVMCTVALLESNVYFLATQGGDK